MLLRQPSPLVDLQGVCISYQETYLFSGMWCRALECASDNKKWYFCQSLCLFFVVFLVCCDSAKKLRSIKSAGIQVLGVSCGFHVAGEQVWTSASAVLSCACLSGASSGNR